MFGKAWEQFEGCLKIFGTAGGTLAKLEGCLKTWKQFEGCMKSFGTAGGTLEKLEGCLKSLRDA
jgi:hypothetical protein